MPCMVPMPDGTVLIANGALHGLAGFAAATKPNLNAVLYNPSLPAGSRFSILGSTTIARMYHSEATLLPDGRVLISGSDPQDKDFPEEYRVEVRLRLYSITTTKMNFFVSQVFIPPYLAEGLKQPTFIVPDKDWAYGGSYAI